MKYFTVFLFQVCMAFVSRCWRVLLISRAATCPGEISKSKPSTCRIRLEGEG